MHQVGGWAGFLVGMQIWGGGGGGVGRFKVRAGQKGFFGEQDLNCKARGGQRTGIASGPIGLIP